MTIYSKKTLPIIKRIVPSLKKRFYRFFYKNGFILHNSFGSRFLLNPKNYVDRQIIFHGSYEKEQLEFLIDCAGKEKYDLFLDVGANFGLYSIHLASRKLVDQIISFEPDKRNFNQFCANILLNDLSEQIELRDEAVSNTVGKISFLASPDTSTGQSKIGEGNGAVTLNCTTLDEVVDLKGRAILMKIDVEGHELSVLKGMQHLANHNTVTLQIECFPEKATELFELLKKMNFQEVHRIGDDFYFSNVNRRT